MDRRTALLEEREEPDVWQTDPERYGALTARAGERKVREAERLVDVVVHRSRVVRSPRPMPPTCAKAST
jgi:hypothetical protein